LVLGLVIGVIGSAASLFFYYVRYYKWRDCFNELGRCYDPDGSHEVYTTAGRMWGFVSIPFLLLTCICVVLLWRRRRDHTRALRTD
jgi:hypothetical protein